MFLPKDYAKPKVAGGDYLNKFLKGETRIRVLSSAIVGWEYWRDNSEGRPEPVRLSEVPEELPSDIRRKEDGSPEDVKHFWSFIVWDYTDSKIKICHITQSSIQGQIQELVSDEDWGDITSYDIKINRTGEGLETRYATTPAPKKELSIEAAEAFEKKPIDLQALFTGDNPFEIDESINPDDIKI